MIGKDLHRAILGNNSSKPFSITKSRPGLKTQDVLDAIALYKLVKRVPRCQKPTPLLVAVHMKCLELVKYLVEEGADVNEGQFIGVGPLSLALLKRNFEIATFLIQSGADVNILDSEGRTPMVFAIQDEGNCPVSFIEQLISAGFPKNGLIQQDTQARPITRAVLAKNLPIVKYLLQQSVDVNYPVTKNDSTPLISAIIHRSFEITELLVKHGANVEGQPIECPAPLISAVVSMIKGDIRCLRLLIGAGVDVHRVFHIKHEEIERDLALQTHIDDRHLTALQFAVILGNIDAAEELLRAGANVNAKTPNTKRTALHLACLIDYVRNEKLREVHKKMVRILIENGADICMKDNSGFSPAKCCYVSKNFPAMEELIKSGINVNENLGGAGSLLTYSVLLSKMDMVRLCLEYGGDSSLEFNSVKAYHMAYKKNNMQIARLFFKYHPMDDIPLWTMHSLPGLYPPMFANQLTFFDGLKLNNEVAVKSALRDGAEPRAFLKDLRYPIFLPVINKSLSILKILLNHGVHPNVNNEQGETPLHLSAGLGFLPGCYKLLQHGAGYNCKSSEGQSPLDVAKSSPTKNLEVVKLLKGINRLFILARKGDKNAILQDFKDLSDLEFSSIVNSVNRKGKTLLKEAIDSGFPDVAELIMTHRLSRQTG